MPTERPAARSLERGRAAERLAEDFLVARGYTVVARNLRVGRDELDLVMRAGPLIVVVEVRCRGAGSWSSAFGSLGAAKRARVRRAAARLWRDRYRADPSAERMRLDVVTVELGRDPPELEHAPASL